LVVSILRAQGVPRARVAVVPYGVDLSAFRPRDEQYELRNGAHSPRGRLVGLYVGHICHGKGLSALLEAARLCRRLPVSFRLVGPIVSREVLHDVPDNVRYEGLLHPAAVPDAMRRADFFVLPTLDDSFGLVVLEAMASGLPVITTRHAGAAEYIDDGADGLVVAPGDARALAAAIARLVEDAPARRRLGEAALRKVRSSGSWEAYGERVLDLVVP
jgi:glycosyltransferase involved in cell wall biosynthesis